MNQKRLSIADDLDSLEENLQNSAKIHKPLFELITRLMKENIEFKHDDDIKLQFQRIWDLLTKSNARSPRYNTFFLNCLLKYDVSFDLQMVIERLKAIRLINDK